MVVPHAGTWIEILLSRSITIQGFHVVPHAGTWIEIGNIIYGNLHGVSFPTRERGLKLLEKAMRYLLCTSFPTRERGLKYIIASALAGILCRSPRGNVD